METQRVLARIVGPLLVIPAVGVFLNLRTYRSLIEEFSRSLALCYLGGFMALLMGLVLLQFHNTWEGRWPVIITILGWITVIKGVTLILFPGLISSFRIPLVATGPLVVSLGISFVVGVFLTIKGYWS
jgi:hypothetical protein